MRSSPRTPSFRDGELVDQGQRPPAGHSRRHNQLSGEFVAQGQRRPRAGHSRRLWKRLWERRRELGANTYRVLVHPTPQAGFGEFLLKPSLFVMRRSEDRPAIGMLRRT